MKKLLLTLSLVLISTLSYAQDYTISGVTMDTLRSEPAAYATVLLFGADAAELKVSTYTDDKGRFSIKTDAGDYTLRVNFVGYAPFERSFTLDQDLDLGVINVTQAIEIGAASVTAQLITADVDKTSYNAELDPEAPALTALEMMRKVPMLSVDAEDEIRLRGETNFKILVNGKSSSLLSGNYKDVLRSMPASSIKRIEVITSPPAKYDAEGIGGIINIVTTRKTIEGFNGSVWASGDTFGGWNTGAYIAGTAGKFNFSGNLYTGHYNQPGSIIDATLTNFNSVDSYTHQYRVENNADGHYNGVSFEMSYEFDSLNLLSFAVNGSLGNYNMENITHNEFFSQIGDPTGSYENVSRSKGDWGGIGASLDYQRTFARPDQLLTASYKVDYNPNGNFAENEILPIFGSTSALHTRSNNDAWGMEHAIQVDYFDPITKNHQIEAGLKYTLRPSLSNSTNEILIGDEWQEDITLKNDLDYMQHIGSAYAAYQYKVKNFTAKAGARAEYTVNDGEYLSIDTTPLFSRYFNLVPYLNFGYKIDNFQSLKLGYTQRISRPGIWLLNPYVDTSNPLYVESGNPNLDPELTHSFELGYGIYKPMFNISATLSAGITNNSIEDVLTIVNQTSYVRPENIGQKYAYRGSLSAGARFFGGKLSFTLNGSLGYLDIRSNDGSNRSNTGTDYNVFAMISGNAWKDGTVTLMGGAGKSGVNLQMDGNVYYFSGLSVSQGFFKKKLNISINAQNPWTKYNYYTITGFDPTTFAFDGKMLQRGQQIKLSASWRFGSAKGAVKKARRTIDNSDQKGGGSAGQTGGGGMM